MRYLIASAGGIELSLTDTAMILQQSMNEQSGITLVMNDEVPQLKVSLAAAGQQFQYFIDLKKMLKQPPNDCPVLYEPDVLIIVRIGLKIVVGGPVHYIS